jgi:hypothetical protein
MSIPVLLAILWVFAATITAMLPMRRQYVPGVILLLAAPALILWMGAVHGWWLAVLGLAAFVSMMRNPLRYLYRRARGEKPELPK